MELENVIKNEIIELTKFLPEKERFKARLLQFLCDINSENICCAQNSDDEIFEEGYEQAIRDVFRFVHEYEDFENE